MRTQKNLKLHARAIAILEMIQGCDRRIYDCRSYLGRESKSWHCSTTKHYERLVEKYLAIKLRLVEYYADVMQRLLKPVIENARVLGTIVVNESGVAEAV